jgi:predicted metal-dependent phosphoesterase TrpH
MMKKSILKKYDLHMHSYYSKCSRNSPEDILKYAKKAGLDGIAITDHHTMKAYPILKKLNKDKNFEIIPGEEIKTQFGDVVALYISIEIKTKDFFQVVKEIKAQGGIAIIPHPFRPIPWLKFKYPFVKVKGMIDAIETFNSRNTTFANARAKAMAEKLGFAQTGSSDAHSLLDIGNGYTLFNGDLRKAIRSKSTKVGGTTKRAFISIMIAAVNARILSKFGRRY